MGDLQDSIIELIKNTSPEKLNQLTKLLRSSPSKIETLSSTWSKTSSNKSRLDKVISSWKESGFSLDELIGILKGASFSSEYLKKEQEIDLVWTGPSSGMIPTRKTEQVLIEVIESAKEKIFLSSFVAYDVEKVLELLRRSIQRGVKVSMLLESSELHGGGVSMDVIAKMKEALPEAFIYYWKKKDDGFDGGKVHAKVAVSDDDICFISSANLTSHALEKNIEAGVLIRGGPIPLKLSAHLETLVSSKILKRS